MFGVVVTHWQKCLSHQPTKNNYLQTFVPQMVNFYLLSTRRDAKGKTLRRGLQLWIKHWNYQHKLFGNSNCCLAHFATAVMKLHCFSGHLTINCVIYITAALSVITETCFPPIGGISAWFHYYTTVKQKTFFFLKLTYIFR